MTSQNNRQDSSAKQSSADTGVDNGQADSNEALVDSPEGQSKSQRKREADEITQLGKTISELGGADLEKIPLDEPLSDAVAELRKIRSFGARKRQLHYLGKLLRKSDLQAIRVALASIEQSANAETRLLHSAENWRKRLLDEGDPALGEFVRQYPGANRQQLRQKIRSHHREKQRSAKGESGKSARDLFRLVRTALLQSDQR